MKRWGGWLMAGLFLSALFGSCGQNGSSRSMSSGEMMEAAENALRERYNITCTAEKATPQGTGPFDEVYTQISLIAPDGETEVLVRMNGSGSEILDNYPLIWMQPKAEEEAQSLANEVWSNAEASASLSASPFEGEWSESDTLARFFAEVGVLADWTFRVDEPKVGQQEQLEKLIDLLYDSGLYGRVTAEFSDGEIYLHGTKETKPSAADIEKAFS